MLDLSGLVQKVLLGTIPAIAGITFFVVFDQKELDNQNISFLPGKPLTAYKTLYPIDTKGDNLGINKDTFMKAVRYFSAKQNVSPKAIADLIYLGQANNISLLLDKDEQVEYRTLLDNTIYDEVRQISEHKDRLFNVYKDIVNGIGHTFQGTKIEVILHDTINPL